MIAVWLAPLAAAAERARTCWPVKPASCSPVAQRNQDRSERQYLADFHAHVEAQNVGHEAACRQRKVLKLRRQAKPVEEAEDEDGDAGVWLKAEEAPEAVQVVE